MLKEAGYGVCIGVGQIACRYRPSTVEPPKRGHFKFGNGTFVLSSDPEVVPISEVHHILISYHLYNV